MILKHLDRNFDTSFECPQDIEWYSIREKPFKTYGIFYSEKEELYRRLPEEVANNVSEAVSTLSKQTAGGRVRFTTNSPYVVLSAKEPFSLPLSHMAICGTHGFSLFANGRFVGTFRPQWEKFLQSEKSTIVVDGIKNPYVLADEPYQAELFFPLYSAVKEVFVGLKKGCILRESKEYTHITPILFYGSSITQGACATKPGDDYVNRLSRMLDTDILNLGFSGNALAEPEMREYLTSLSSSIFVMDYDYNAPTVEYLEKTHYKLYETFRFVHPVVPIVMMTMPTIDGYEQRPYNADRKKVIFESFNRAKARGDNNVYLVDCYGCFGNLENGECGTVDDCHPDSLGFLRMAQRVYPLLNQLLNNNMGASKNSQTIAKKNKI